jgi:putative ABC transport system permease protein
MNLIELALRNLRRRPIRSSLTIIGIALAVGSALGLTALSRSIQDSAREGMDEIGDDLVVMQKGASDVFGGFIPELTVEQVAAVPGVARAAGELIVVVPGDNGGSMLMLGWPGASYLWKKVPLREGRVPAAGEHEVAVLGEGVAASLGKRAGDPLTIMGETIRVIGIANYTTVVNRAMILLPLEDLQEAALRPRQVTLIHVNIDRGPPAVDLGRVRADIEALGNLTASTADEVLNNDRNFAILNAVSLAVAIIAVGVGALNVLNTLVMATQERTRELAILAAIGWSNSRIMASIVIEGLVMCAIGCMLGVLLSFLVALAFPYIPAIGNLISFKPSVVMIAPTLLAALLLCLLGSLLPAWRAVRMVPAEALRRI